MSKAKSFEITQEEILAAFKKVKANKGAAGIDGVSLEEYEKSLENNLYKLWNRMASGSYFPQPVRGVEIPKKNGNSVRILGVPTIHDRIAQNVIVARFQPTVEPYFLLDSYGYRPGKTAIDAIRVTRERCWAYDWMIEFDIVGLFDNIDHNLLMKAVRRHTQIPWVILYIERALKAPMVLPEGHKHERTRGTPQGGVTSAILANLFMHYAFDRWMQMNLPNNPWARYADDGIVHCHSREEAESILEQLKARMKDCQLEIHPTKTRIVYCKDDNRREEHDQTQVDFLGYTFRRRIMKTKTGKYFGGFNPAVSKDAIKTFESKIKQHRKRALLSLEDLAEQLNPILRGWTNYFKPFTASAVHKVLSRVNLSLARWTMKKLKRYKRKFKAALAWLGRVAATRPNLFYHWQMGIRPATD